MVHELRARLDPGPLVKQTDQRDVLAGAAAAAADVGSGGRPLVHNGAGGGPRGGGGGHLVGGVEAHRPLVAALPETLVRPPVEQVLEHLVVIRHGGGPTDLGSRFTHFLLFFPD